ncbi:MAG: FtsQ-type POTRA domain-containing protein [Firmicutes bacterium]|jgi:cell division protein FtsQ|nr:FtsQ-type POTRA domain-containing protein [Bacillota bacterium]
MSNRSFRLLFVLFLILIGLGQGLMRSPYFTVKEVQVLGTNQVNPEEVTALTGVLPGQNIFSLRTQTVVKAVSGHPWVQSIELVRQLPNKVLLHVTERKPLFIVPYRTSFLEIAADGVVLALRPTLTGTGQALPLVTGFSIQDEVRLGQRLPGEKVAVISDCLQGLPAEFLNQVAEIHLDQNHEITLYMLKGVQILLGEPVKLKQKLALLTGTWSELGAHGQMPASIDLRTGKEAVVRLK